MSTAGNTLTGAQYAALRPDQQQALGNGVDLATVLAMAPPVPAATAAVYNYTTATVTIPFGDALETVATLDSFMSQWAAGVATFPSSLSGADPYTEAAAIVADRCSVINTPDCAQASAIAQRYAASVVPYLPGGTPPAAPPAPGYGIGVTPGAPPAPAAGAPATPTVPASAAPVTPVRAVNVTPPPIDRSVAPSSPRNIPLPLAPTPKLIIEGGIAAGGIAAAPATFGISIVVAIIASLFASFFGGSDTKKLAEAVNQLRAALAQSVDELYRFSWQIVRALGKLLNMIHEDLVGWRDALWKLIKNMLNEIWKLVSEAIPQIIKFLKQLRKWLDEIYRKYIRPILNYIQHIRKWLAIARALHIPFADKLDKILVRIQAKIIGPYLYVLRLFNVYGSWINVILTKRGTIQRPVILGTIYENKGKIIDILLDGATDPNGATAGPTQPAPQPSTKEQAIDHVKHYAAGQGGPRSSCIDPACAALVTAVGVALAL